MNALVVFESMFGNTARIAEAVALGMHRAAQVEVREVGTAPASIVDVDLLVVGGPTHAWGMSRRATRRDARERARARRIHPVSMGPGVREWLADLALPPGQRVAVFDTALRTEWPTGSAARAVARRLRARGCTLVADPEQFRVRDVAGPPLDGELARASAWGATLPALARAAAATPSDVAAP